MKESTKTAKGRREKPTNEEKLKSVCKRWREREITARRAMYEMNMSASTFYRRVNSRGL